MSYRQKQHGGLLDGINKPQVAVYCRSHILTSADQKVTPWLVPIMLSIIHHTYSYPSQHMLLHKESVYHTYVLSIAICNLQSMQLHPTSSWMVVSLTLQSFALDHRPSHPQRNAHRSNCSAMHHRAVLWSTIAVQSADGSYLSIMYTIHICTMYYHCTAQQHYRVRMVDGSYLSIIFTIHI